MNKKTEFVTIEGRNMVADALRSPALVEEVIIHDAVRDDERVKEIMGVCKQKNIPYRLVEKREIEEMSDSYNPQGVVALMKLPEVPSLERFLEDKRDAFIVMVDQIDYEQNLGSLLRSAWAGGVDLIIASNNGVSEVSGVVSKVSMGGAAYVPVLKMSLFQAIKILKKMAVRVIGVEVLKGKEYTNANLRGPVAFVLGGEARGLSKPLMDECDELVYIDMKGDIASLNVAVAGAILIFEKNRQEKTG